MLNQIRQRGWFASLFPAPRKGYARHQGGGNASGEMQSPPVSLLPVIDGNFVAETTYCHDELWPDDPDQVPDWRIKYEQRALEIGMVLPPIRTFRHHIDAIAKCEASLFAKQPINVVGRPLSAEDAAVQFLSWLRETSRTGEFSNETLAGYYADFCSLQNREPTAENMLRGALKRLPGVTTRQGYHKSQAGARVRPTIWIIKREVPSVSHQFRTETERLAA